MPSYPLVLLLTVAVVCCIGMAIATWPRRDDPTVQAFLVLAFGAVVWSGGRLLEISSADLPGRILRVSPDLLPAGSVTIASVEIDEKPWTDFDAKALTVHLPDVQSRVRVKVRLRPETK